jgi:secondary thiamine-phosphate synthase enzyme
MESTTFEVRTGDRLAIVDLTARIDGWLHGRGDGLCNVLAPHATCGLALLEANQGTEQDAELVLSAVLPRDDRWAHRHGSRGHGADHILPLFVTPTLTLPVIGSTLELGVWQSVVLVDGNVDNPVRTIRLSLLRG